MLLEDMGIFDPNETGILEPVRIIMDIRKKGSERLTSFRLSIFQGKTLSNYPGDQNDDSKQRLGVALDGLQTPDVYGPTDRFFDGVHQYVTGLYRKGDRLATGLEHLQRHNPAVLSDLVVQSAGWVIDVIKSRVLPTQSESRQF